MKTIFKTRILVCVAVAFAIGFAAQSAEARRGKRKAKINGKAIAELRAQYTFGMSKRKVLKELKSQIWERYQEKIGETSDIATQDSLRKKRNAEYARIIKSYIVFNGNKTGWEGSIIQLEFRHKAGEALLVQEEVDAKTGRDQKRFFFFHKGKLYKIYVALSSSTLAADQRNFPFLRMFMEKRFGPGKVAFLTKRDGTEIPYAVEWDSGKYHAAAIDNMEVFGAFCISVADQGLRKRVLAARSKLPKKGERSSFVDAVVEAEDNDDDFDLGDNSAVNGLLKN